MNTKKITICIFFIIFIYRPVYIILNWNTITDSLKPTFSSYLINLMMIFNILISLVPAIVIYYSLFVEKNVKTILYSQISFFCLLLFTILKIFIEFFYNLKDETITITDRILDLTYNLSFFAGLFYMYIDFESIDGVVAPIIGNLDHLIKFSLF